MEYFNKNFEGDGKVFKGGKGRKGKQKSKGAVERMDSP